MAIVMNPYLSFDGNARQAMEYYRSVFGGELTMNTFGEFGNADQPGADKIMHAQLNADQGITLMASDMPPGMDHQPGNSMTVSLSGDDAGQLRGYWEKLTEGGSVSMPMEKQMWGDEFGMCTDQYGVPWMVNITQPTA